MQRNTKERRAEVASFLRINKPRHIKDVVAHLETMDMKTTYLTVANDMRALGAYRDLKNDYYFLPTIETVTLEA